KGEVSAAGAHDDAALSPYAPPPVTEFAAVNDAMLPRAGDRARLAAQWRVGEPYTDTFVHTLRIRPASRPAATRRSETLVSGESSSVVPAVVPAENGVLAVGGELPTGIAKQSLTAAGLSLLFAGVSLRIRLLWLAVVFVVAMLGALGAGVVRVWRAGRLVIDAARPVDALRIAYAVADGLQAAELSPVGATAVRWSVEPDGSYQLFLDGVTPEVSARFA